MMKFATVATCNLNQWAMDFSGNRDRIRRSCVEAKTKGATLRLGPELEIPGYGCEDHFLETDTVLHSWQVLVELLSDDTTDGIICDFGMPVLHRNVLYNCRVICLDRKILLIRPKMFLANDGNYREGRYFTGWRKRRSLEDHYLPSIITAVTNQRMVKFGEGVISTRDTCIGSESCEELFTPDSPHIAMSLDGIEIITNGSGSHHQLRKLNTRIDLITGATSKCGGVYMYANQIGCDGSRLYFDGCSTIAINDTVVAQGSQFSLKEVEVVTATISLEQVRSYRASIASRSSQATDAPVYPRVDVDFALCHSWNGSADKGPTSAIAVRYHDPMEEIALGPACWLWDYLRRSGLAGFFLPLSGGADSTAVAAIIGSMCQLASKEAAAGNDAVVSQVRRLTGIEPETSGALTVSSQQLATALFHTTYLGTVHSSTETRSRAADVARDVGAYHLDVDIDTVVAAVVGVFTTCTGKTPRFRSAGGCVEENLALQNIQARIRMVLSYLFAQLLPWCRGKGGSLLVLGTANVDEALRGYYTKYDCSSADVNPIGAICKSDLKSFMAWASCSLNYKSMQSVVEATPTAELEPSTDGYVQTDEADMGMTYDELGVYGRLRKLSRLGPYGMFSHLAVEWAAKCTPQQVADKVKHFFKYYAINRHKMTTLTPGYHAESYSPCDNRYDLRQFLYNARWPYQFDKIDKLVLQMNEGSSA